MESKKEEFVAIPIQVDSRCEWVNESRADADLAGRNSFFGPLDTRDSLFEPIKRRKRSYCAWIPKKEVCMFMDSWPYQVFVLLMVFYTLFAYSISILCQAPNSASPYIDAFLIMCMAIFSVEIALNICCRPRIPWFLLILDMIATASIVVDLSWVANALNLENSNGSQTSSAALVSARAGRIVRLVRLLRLLRTISILSAFAKRAMQHRKAADLKNNSAADPFSTNNSKKTASTSKTDKNLHCPPPVSRSTNPDGSPSNIGTKLTDALIMQVALVVIITVVATALLLSWSVDPSPFDSYVSYLEVIADKDRSEIEPTVNEMLRFAEKHLPRQIPLTLRVGNQTWSWLDEHHGYPRRKSGTAGFKSEETMNSTILDVASTQSTKLESTWNSSLLNPKVFMEVDVSKENSRDALLDILIVVTVLVILLVFVACINITIYKTLVRPLERIFNMIRTHAAQVVAALGPSQNTADLDPDTMDEDGDIGTMEAAISKMLRIVAHSATPGQEGAHVARTLAADADQGTKDWLATMVGDGVKEAVTSETAPLSAPALHQHDTKSSARGDQNRPSTSHTTSNNNNNPMTSGFMNTVRNVRFSLVSGATSSAGMVAAAAISAANQLGGTANARASASSNQSFSQESGGGQNPGSLPPSRPNTGSFGIIPSPSFAFDINSPNSNLPLMGGTPHASTTANMPSPMVCQWSTSPLFGDKLTDIQKEALLSVDLESLHSFRFDVLALHPDELAAHIVAMFLQLDLAYFGTKSSPCNFVQVHVLWRFVNEISLLYHDVPYHNLYHCVDVTHAVFLLVDRLQMPVSLTPLECFALLIAALSHDIDHPGVNNAFLVNAKDPLALTYNDASVLENRHVACLYGMISNRPELDIFEELDDKMWRDVRRMIIASILHTDMTQHFPMVSKLEVFLELKAADIHDAHAAQRHVLRSQLHSSSPSSISNPSANNNNNDDATPVALKKSSARMSAFTAAYNTPTALSLPPLFSTPEERTLLLSMILHCADISNPARPTVIAEKWADRVLAEFFAQGDKERSSGQAISPLCDRETTRRPASQINFIEFVVAPLFSLVSRILPDIGELIDNTSATRQFWQAIHIAELASDQSKTEGERKAEIEKAEARMIAFKEKYKEALTVSAKRRRDLRHRLNSLPSMNAMARTSNGSTSSASMTLQKQASMAASKSSSCSPITNNNGSSDGVSISSQALLSKQPQEPRGSLAFVPVLPSSNRTSGASSLSMKSSAVDPQSNSRCASPQIPSNNTAKSPSPPRKLSSASDAHSGFNSRRNSNTTKHQPFSDTKNEPSCRIDVYTTSAGIAPPSPAAQVVDIDCTNTAVRDSNNEQQ